MSHALRELAGTRDLLPLAAANPARYPGLLDSAARGTARARHDILFAFPQSAIRLGADGVLDGAPGSGFLDALDAHWQAGRLPPGAPGLPFRGGWLLYLGYELAREIEPTLRLPGVDWPGMPVALALRCPAAIVVDHVRGITTLVAEPGHAGLLEAMQSDLASAPAAVSVLPPLRAVEEDPPQAFLDGVACVHRHLLDGNVFQANISRAWHATFEAPVVPASLLAALRRANPAPFAGLLQQPGWAIASSSPERLLESRDGCVQTRPIAGTRPRASGSADAENLRALVLHPKERAEHVMLVDLQRNDLGRVCVPGSIAVDEFMVTESHAHVHHIVSNVRGELRAGTTPGQAIAAVFPGGTITGCPKVRCMQVIGDIEGVGRGAYTGALGYLDRSGDLDLNILIRTLVASGHRVGFRAGAGIVADSVAEAELAETRAKARGLLRALGIAEND
jgi:anthranilate synthase component 1